MEVDGSSKGAKWGVWSEKCILVDSRDGFAMDKRESKNPLRSDRGFGLPFPPPVSTMDQLYSGIPISRTSKGAKICSRNREVRNIGGKITLKQIQGKRLLVRVIGVFEKSRVREIGMIALCKIKPISSTVM